MRKKKNKLVDTIVDAIQDKKGQNIVVADFQDIPDFICTHFIICQGNSRPQVEAIARNVGEYTYAHAGEKPIAVSGENNALWIAIDYGDIMVHIFEPQTRGFYDLEHLWEDARLTEIPDPDSISNQ